MLRNPFTPTEIASLPEDFFGRSDELRTLERSLIQGSVAIQGPIGIGKSSLLARGLLLMEGFDSGRKAHSLVAVGHRDVTATDDAAGLVLHSLLEVDEKQKRVRFKLGSVFEHESAEITRNFVAGRHLDVLKRVVEREFADRLLGDNSYLILAIDEADKCPTPLARLVRSIVTHTQQHGVKRVRFLLAGVTPFFQQMVDEDSGVGRFFHKTISLSPLTLDEARAFIEAKLSQAARWAEEDGLALSVHPRVIDRVVALSGGHPHLLQLLGSHLIEHEDDDPDGMIDSADLHRSLVRICYEDRTNVYSRTIHELEVHGRFEVLQRLLGLAAPGFPTRIQRKLAEFDGNPDAIHWLLEHGILRVVSSREYGLVDEFLRIRMLFDREESEAQRAAVERRLLKRALTESPTIDAPEEDDEDEEDDE